MAEMFIEDFVGAPSGRSFEKAYPCIVCGLTFKERETTTFRGKRYGKPCGCANDIRQLSQRGAK